MFDQTYRKIILEQAIQQDLQTVDTMFFRKITDSNQFLKTYMYPLNKDNRLVIGKSMEDVFRVYGKLDDIFNFLQKFRVDQKFLQDPSTFILVAPSIVLSTQAITHLYNFDQRPLPPTAFDQNNVNFNSLLPGIIQGRWIDLYFNDQNGFPLRVKRSTPKQLIKHIKNLIQTHNIQTDNLSIAVEFYINCRGCSSVNAAQNVIQVPIG